MASVNDFGPGGLLYPTLTPVGQVGVAPGAFSHSTLDAVGESLHFIGTVFIDGRPASAKTISSAGGGSISWLPATIDFNDAGTTIRVGIQDVDETTGSPARGDGTFDVYADLVGGTDTITAGVWRTDDMEVGTKSITHGDMIAIVFNVEAQTGADSVTVRWITASQSFHAPGVTHEAPANTFAPIAALPNALITFDDGTLGWIYGSLIFSVTNTHNFDSASTPDEYASIFQFSRPTPVDALWTYIHPVDLVGTTELILYSNPEGTPVVEATITLDHDRRQSNGGRYYQVSLPTVFECAANTKYAVAVRPTGAENIVANSVDVAAAAHLKSMPGGTQSYYGTRSDQTGAFSTTLTRRLVAGVVACGGSDAAAGGGQGISQGLHTISNQVSS